MGLYPFFDTLIQHKPSVKAMGVINKHTDPGLPPSSIRQIKTDIDAIKSCIRMAKAQLFYLIDIIYFTEGDTSDNGLSIFQQGSQICHGLPLLFSTTIDTNCLNFELLHDYTSSPRRIERLREGVKEVEKFLSKLELTILLIPRASLDSSLDSSVCIETINHSTEECEMDLSKIPFG